MSSKGVITEAADQNIYAACRTMRDHDIGSVVIVEKDTARNKDAIGIITERDVVRLLGAPKPTSPLTPLSDVMSKPLITISIMGSIKDAIQTMHRNNIRHLVLIDRDHGRCNNR